MEAKMPQRFRDEQHRNIDPGYWDPRSAGSQDSRRVQGRDPREHRGGRGAYTGDHDEDYPRYGGAATGEDFYRENSGYRADERGRTDWDQRQDWDLRQRFERGMERDFAPGNRERYEQRGSYDTGWTGAGFQPSQGASYGEPGHRRYSSMDPMRGDPNFGRTEYDRHIGLGQSSLGNRESGEHAGSGYGAHQGRGPKNYQRSAERVIEDICEKLTDDPHVDASEVNVQCKDGVVTIEGTVPHRSMKHRVEDIADHCYGVKDVDNRLKVSASQSGPQSATAGQDGTRKTGPATTH
jgi:hypothetical protein